MKSETSVEVGGASLHQLRLMLQESRDPAIYEELERRHRENLGPSLSLEQLKKGLDTHLALVDLMRAIRKHGRPSKLPDDVRAAWDECERVLGDELAAAIERQEAA